ncbi:hypothetical protein C8250_041080 [Streptomyces sp. So13.3]|uniref:hypothetical protein n=1 Tax=Streptomyces TaxID=1883 RepID=UPI00164E18F4|nr:MULTISPECIES: hypothetical protein [Streptomyces]MCZ4098439.1 hypothetical protein [Streptomyces sp. H39-C1]QNA77362.1 hypothetical protein C8250_041080 [Streptomyces sp. So13.3]
MAESFQKGCRPETVRRLTDAAAPILEMRSSVQNLEVDGWPYFAKVTTQVGG